MTQIDVHSVAARPAEIPTPTSQYFSAVDNGPRTDSWVDPEMRPLFPQEELDYLVRIQRRKINNATYNSELTVEGAEMLIAQLQASVAAVRARREAAQS